MQAPLNVVSAAYQSHPWLEIHKNCTRVIYRPATVETVGIIIAWLLIGLMVTGSAALFWVSQR
jgi:hypothetical protein